MIELKTNIKINSKIFKELLDHPAEFSRKTIWAGMTRLVEAIEALGKKRGAGKEF